VKPQKKHRVFPEYYATEYAKRKVAIESRLQDFLAIQEDVWFYEACYCILTPQSKAVNAEFVVNALKEQHFEYADLDPMPFLRNPEHYIRFHNQKSKNLLKLKEQFIEIKQIIHDHRDQPLQLRDILTGKIRGFGMKESAHFMRNIGIFGPTILDRHILKHLLACGIKSAEKAPSSKNMYLKIEQDWLQYCDAVNITMESMDLLFWSIETGFILK
jgi:N-glycosylase/DNA lyase